MLGTRLGSSVGSLVGSQLYPADDEGGFFGIMNPNLAALEVLQSNALGRGVAANMTGYPGISTAYPNVKITRRGSMLTNPPIWVTEGPIDLQPRTVQLDVTAYPIGTNGIELSCGRRLDSVVGPSGKWRWIQMAINSSGLENNWLNPAYPVSGGQLMDQLITEIKAQLTAMNARLELVIPIGGETDAAESPDFTDFKANLGTFVSRLRSVFGPCRVVIPTLSWHTNIGNSTANVITAAQEVCVADGNAQYVNTSLLALRDSVHYADVNGYGELGDMVADAYGAIRDNTVPNHPYVTAVGTPSFANSGSNLGPLYVPVHQAGDVHVLLVSNQGPNAYATPSGWTAFPNGVQWAAGNNLNSRCQAWWRRAVDSATPQPTIADAVSDATKTGFVFSVRGCTASGNPFDVDSGASTGTAGTAVTCAALTTTVANTLVVNIVSAAVALNVPQFSGWTNVDLTEQKEIINLDSSLGFAVGVFAGVKAAAGAVSATTATLATSSTFASVNVAFKP